MGLDEKQILELRSAKTPRDPWKHLGIVHEQETDARGKLVETSTVFLVGSECPFRCLMCDLWQYTLDQPTPSDALPKQLSEALQQIPHRQTIKLYNASNFFDRRSVPTEDLPKLAELCRDFERVIVENHPRLVSQKIVEFQSQINGQLEIAMGLETADPQILAGLNKRMTRESFATATAQLHSWGIQTRAFAIFQLPGVSPEAACDDAQNTVRFAYDCGIDVCTLIPLRPGNGAVDHLIQQNAATLPTLADYRAAAENCLKIAQRSNRVLLVDLWDMDQFQHCPDCLPHQLKILTAINQQQTRLALSFCPTCQSDR